MTAIIIQARMGSTRLPGKVMKNLAGHEVLWHVVSRCTKALADKVIVATTTKLEDDVIENFCRKNSINYFRGSSDNVLERYYLAAERHGADRIVRITSDCPLIDPAVINLCVQSFHRQNCDYVSNCVPGSRTFPIGLETEVFSFAALKKANQEANENYEKEHVTPYIWENKKREFKIGDKVLAPLEYNRSYRIGLDYPEDFLLIEKIYNNFYHEEEMISVPEVLKWLDAHPEAVKINASCIQKLAK